MNINYIGKKIIWIIDGIINMILLTIIVLTMVFGIYSIMDNKQLEQQANSENYKMFKPTAENVVTFTELQKLNSDIIGWITLDNTPIDYPLLQGSDNDIYINTAPDKSFSLTGSIFLDYRNSPDFSDFNSIIYGHHVENDVMFGGIDKFSNKEYFDNHKYGSIFFNNKKYKLEIYAYIIADAYDMSIFQPNIQSENCEDYLNKIKSSSLNYRNINITTNDNIVLLSTCSSEMTNGRSIIVTKIGHEIPLNTEKNNTSEKITNKSGEEIETKDESVSVKIIIISIFIIILVVIFLLKIKKGKNHDK